MRLFLSACMAVLIAGMTPALADKGGRGDDDDRRTLERAHARGDVLPLARIVDLLKEQGIAGEILEVELEDDDGALIYEIYVLGTDGRRREVKVDPATGRVLERDHD